MPARKRVLVIACAALTLVAVLATTASAFAAPLEPTLGLTSLQTLLNNSASGTVDGYFKTVVKGQTIVQVPVTIQGITSGSRAGTSLILFEATGPLMAQYGGIVSGMSGSPIYVHTGGADKIVGAVSYGDYFTLGGTGLATPIESMMALENTYEPQVMSLRRAVVSSGRLIDRVIVAADPQDFAGAEDNGALVAKPLSSIFIGGLNPSGTAYKALVTDLAKHNVSVVTLGAPLGGLSGDTDSTLSADLVSGAAVASLASRGDLWVGGIGTVTYADNGNVLAFGHPAFWAGDTNLFMSNAWIDGVWPSLYEPYKVGRPTATRGQFTQDRFAGILGKVGSFPSETTVTAHATNIDTGESLTTHVYIPRPLLSTGQWNSQLVAAAVSVSAEKLIDSGYADGSAQTTTTVRVNDGAHEYVVTIPDVTDSSDVGWGMTNDTTLIVDELQDVLANGTQTPEIESVDFEMSYTKHHSSARIVGVDVPAGLKTGENIATVTFVAYGQPDFVTQNIAFTIPAGIPLSGVLTASSSEEANSPTETASSSETTPGPISGWIETVADAVDYLKSVQPDDVVKLTYVPNASSGSADGVARSAATPWELSGIAVANSPVISTEFSATTVDYRGTTSISGTVNGPTADSTVEIYAKSAVAGESAPWKHLATVTAEYDASREEASFETQVGDLPTTSKVRFHIAGHDGWLSSDATRTLKVRANTHLSVSTTTPQSMKSFTLSARVLPAAAAGSKVSFQYWNKHQGAWITLSTRTLAVSGGAARTKVVWQLGKGTWKVRARFRGGPSNAASASNAVSLHVG